MDIEKLSLAQKIGQMFLVSFDGTSILPETKAHFLKNSLGNYIFFAKNLTDFRSIRELSDSLQATAFEICGVPAFVSADQEGGMVARVHSGSAHFPASMAVAASGVPMSDIERVGQLVGEGLKRVGINLNHAPVVDVNNNPQNPVIGTRSFSDDPAVVSAMAVAYIRGLQNSGVLANVKHFPGHGDTDTDSHLALPAVAHDISRLNAVELVPFRGAISGGVDSVMTAHILFKAIDDLPATLSHKIITGLLRVEMGFRGLVITDCMSMEAIKTHFTTEKGCVMAINAGADLLCLNADIPTQERCVRAVREAVERGEISMEKIDDALRRILKYKRKYAYDKASPPLAVYPAHEELADEISEKSITLVHSGDDLLPLKGRRVFAISTIPHRANIADDILAKAEIFAEYAAAALDGEFAAIGADPDTGEIAATIQKAADYNVILYATCNAAQNPGQVRLFDALKSAGKRIVLVSLRAPYDITLMPSADAYIAAYEYTNRSVTSATKALLGEIPFAGKLPVRMT
ncbi:MAG: glycoside hydrolase family 3 protein [Defluviitaleaceae bacterium]|nr:glycoside hydrolase family 3 protein [Defluviitaleaceae bacterium]